MPGLLKLFADSELTAGEKAELEDTNRWTRLSTNEWQLTPSVELIVGLSPASRQSIYPVLSRDERNEQYSPFLAHPSRSDLWFSGVDLSPEAFRTFRGMVYTNQGSLCFADLETYEHVFPGEPTSRLLRIVSRIPTLLMELKIDEGTDVDEVLRTWGRFQGESLRPLLTALSKTPGGGSLSLYHFLSPFARQRLYTYPEPQSDPLAARRDCFWSAMNFFEKTPHDEYFDFQYTADVVRRRFDPVQGERQFGDLIALIDRTDRIVHLCVHVADDIVFTKNGASIHQPWILMRWDDVCAKYPSENRLRTSVFRAQPGSFNWSAAAPEG